MKNQDTTPQVKLTRPEGQEIKMAVLKYRFDDALNRDPDFDLNQLDQPSELTITRTQDELDGGDVVLFNGNGYMATYRWLRGVDGIIEIEESEQPRN